MAFPRGAALAELGWSPAERLSWEDFAQRLPVQEARYQLLGLPAPPPPAPALQPSRRLGRQLDMCSDKLILALEDDFPLEGDRAVFLIDVMQPCWIWRGADLTGVNAISASVGQAPFNFQIGDAVNGITFRPPATPEGELEVRLGCEGERIAVLPLAPASANPGVTQLPSARISPRDGVHDLCFTFTARGVDPMYSVVSVELVGPAVGSRQSAVGDGE
jgi:hexosaminidase